ncbi:MAG TPA: hypothetical protein VER04_26190 [Polyangiaceae bacterium]|nr:hypothetical protein [Polyangiaceae bacterium]
MANFSGSSPSRALGLKRRWARVCVLGLGLGAFGCRARGTSPVYIVAGPAPSEHVEFRPRSSYAEYLLLPGQRRELKITLASYETSCDSFVAPSERDASATITVITPAEGELSAGSYAWAGQLADGGTEQQPERAYALPTIRLGHRGLTLPAGGEIRLESVATTQDGRVRGLLDFEFPGDGEHVATSLKGSFEAKLCRVRL